MAKGKSKGKTFTMDEKAILKRKDIDHRFWEPIEQQPGSMIIKHRFTEEVRVIHKK